MSKSVPPRINILLIEDDDDDILITRELLTDGLQDSWHLEVRNTYDSGLEALVSGAFDVALVDLRLGPESGLDLITAAGKSLGLTPAILLTGQGDEYNDLNAIDLGAADYLVKGAVDPLSMARSIRYAIDRAANTARLAESETRYRQLFDDNPEPLALVDVRNGSIVTINRAGRELYGLAAGIEEFFLAELRVPDDELDSILLDTGLKDYRPRPNAVLEVHRHSNGEFLFVEVTKNPLQYRGEDRWLFMFTDVSQRITALTKAERSEKAYVNLISDLRDAVFVVNREKKVFYANPAAREFLSSMAMATLNLPIELEEEMDGQLNICELTTDSGVTRWIEVQSSPTNWQGSPMTLLTIRDITQRIHAEEKMRLLQRGIDASSNGILIIDAKQAGLPILYVNPAFERISGYHAQDILGREYNLLHQEAAEDSKVEQIRSALRNHDEVRIVMKSYRKDGSPFWNDIYIAPVPDDHGTVTHFICIQNDISESREAETRLAYNTSHDVLTGLPNRSLLEDRLHQGLQFAERHQCSLAVLFLDLDDFRPINESLGHLAGDNVLIQVAKRLSNIVRAGDTVARIGGDEFIVLLPDLAKPEHVVRVIENLLKLLSKPFEVSGRMLQLTVSVGVTMADQVMDHPMELVQQADMAKREAKQKGKNTYHWYTSELNEQANNRVLLRNEIERAIELDHFVLHYQPIVNGRTGKIAGSEALVRWQDPYRGTIPPAEFIPIAEETGQIVKLGRWVLEKACRDNKRILDAGYSDHVVSVNVAPLQIQQANFVSVVRDALDKSGLPPERLDIEIVESSFLGEANQAIENLVALKKLGVGIAIDDFGTGFSNLSYMKALPATKLKIDRSFIKNVISDRADASITQGIVSMAHHLNLEVVAEGVETDAHVSFLRRVHCDLLQGFFFSRPIPIENLMPLLDGKALELGAATSSEERPTLLILDDEQNILRALTRLFRRDGYQILTTTDVSEAFRLLAEHDVQVVISDQRMPEISGTEFLSQVKDIYPNTIRIVLSGYTDLKSITDAINEGAIYKFLTKPWDDEQIRRNIKQAFLHYAAGQAAIE